MRPNDLLHNPFRNRFHDPVTWRLDEMYAHSNLLWQRHHQESELQRTSVDRLDATPAAGVFGGIFALALVVLASVVILFKA